MENELNVSNSELVIMRIIWSLGSLDTDVGKIMNELKDIYGWSASTVKTLLARLVKKAMLTTEKEGHKYFYRPTLSEEQAVEIMTDEFLRKVCSHKHTQAMLKMVRECNFTQSDISSIALALAQKTAVEEVPCNCLRDLKVCACTDGSETGACTDAVSEDRELSANANAISEETKPRAGAKVIPMEEMN